MVSVRIKKAKKAHPIFLELGLQIEVIAKLALEAKFDDFEVDSVSRKLTYPVGHR